MEIRYLPIIVTNLPCIIHICHAYSMLFHSHKKEWNELIALSYHTNKFWREICKAIPAEDI